jgi:CheY-like chemotaxis protein
LHERAKELNVKYLLTKPVKQNELYYYLNSINGTDNIDAIPIQKTLPSSDELKEINDIEFCVLVAEDTQMNMLVIRNMLKSILPKVTIIEASNGLEAIREMRNHKPNIVLMDVQMPELDGLEATRQIRKLKNGLSVPIIALTAGVSKEEREFCFKSGMDDFLSKPIERNELKRITQKYLFKEVKKEIVEEMHFTESIHFERNKLLSKIGSEDVLHSLLLMSKTEYPKYIAEIEDAIKNGDEVLIKQKAHKLKGSALNMEFIALGEISKEIELNASNFDTLIVLSKELVEAWKKLLIEIN